MARLARRYGIVLIVASLAVLVAACGTTAAEDASYSYPYTFPTTGRDAQGQYGPVVLGGNDYAFIDLLGAPVDEFGIPDTSNYKVMAFNHYANTFVDGVTIVRDDADPALVHRAIVVMLEALPDQPWPQSTAQHNCISFAPADAQFQREAPLQGARGLGGTDMVYSSQTLAALFPPHLFLDEDGNQVTPGLFNIQYSYPSAHQTNQVLSCQLAFGTQQTVFT